MQHANLLCSVLQAYSLSSCIGEGIGEWRGRWSVEEKEVMSQSAPLTHHSPLLHISLSCSISIFFFQSRELEVQNLAHHQVREGSIWHTVQALFCCSSWLCGIADSYPSSTVLRAPRGEANVLCYHVSLQRTMTTSALPLIIVIVQYSLYICTGGRLTSLCIPCHICDADDSVYQTLLNLPS